MTTNGLIALENLLLAGILALIGGTLLWHSRHHLTEWPSPALVAIAGPFLALALMFAGTTLSRAYALPSVFEPDGVVTLLIRTSVLVTSAALFTRLARGRLLTARDRARLRGSP